MLEPRRPLPPRIVVTRAAALFVALALFVSGCSSGSKEDHTDDPVTESDTALDAIHVTGGFGEKPTVTIDTPFSTGSTTREVLVEGSGEEVTANAQVTFNLLLVNAKDQSVITNTFESDPATVTANNALLPGVRKALVGTKVGSRVLVAIAPDDAYGPQGGDPANGIGADDTLVLVADVLKVRRPLARAQGMKVNLPAGLPTVTADEQGRTTIKVPTGPPPTDLVVQPVIDGGGDVVEAGQTITVHYTGVIWATGNEFDSSWANASPTQFQIGMGRVISAWDKGLVGRKVGSQIMLIVPPGEGYGSKGAPEAGISPTDTLVFVVDILDTTS
jgi:peptidylprolyl isomerase